MFSRFHYARPRSGSLPPGRRNGRRLFFLAGLLLLAISVPGGDIYVSLNGTNNPPYTNWAGAATRIEWAVNVGTNGDTVWISNGVYVLTNQITVTNNLAIYGTNGTVVVDGNNSNRCFYFSITATGALGNIFITRGNTNAAGGGVYMYAGAVRDCVFSNNNASNSTGGGLYINGGTALVQSCRFLANQAENGAGVGLNGGGILRNALLAGNTATNFGGGAWLSNSSLESCTVVNNSAAVAGGGVYIYNAGNGTNNIIYFNTASNAANFTNTAGNSGLDYSCVLPAVSGAGNITNDPLFVDTNVANYRLRTNSPCLHAGITQAWMAGAFDLDGQLPRMINTNVDLGAYEAAYFFSLRPTRFTNTIMRGAATNFSVTLTNSSAFTQLYWQAASTAGWMALSAAGGTIATNGTNLIIITNTAAAIAAPGTYAGQLSFRPTNSALQFYPQTGVVDMTLQVAEFARSSALLAKTIRQTGVTNASLQIWNAGSGELPYTIRTNTSWLAVAPVSGVLTGQTSGATNTLTVVFTNTPLIVGTNYGILTMVSGIDGSTLDVNVELNVTTGPQLLVNPQSFSRSVMMGQSVGAHTARVANGSSAESIAYRITNDSAWVTVTPTNGLLAPLTTNELVISYSAASLTTNAVGPSNYHGTITLTVTNTEALGSPATINTYLTVNPRARLALNTTVLTNIITAGQDATNSALEVWNGSGSYTLNFAFSDNVDWLALTPAAGTSTGEHYNIQVAFNTIGFSTGVSNAVITVTGRSFDGLSTDNAVDATQTVAVSVTIIPAATLATDAAANYNFAIRQGQSIGATAFRVWNGSPVSGSTLRFAITTNASWLSAQPVAGASAGEMNNIVFNCRTAGLSPGHYTGAIGLSGTDAATGAQAYHSPTNFTVELTITAAKGFDFGGDGNGACDLVVYQESTGLWNIKNLYSGYSTNAVFGGNGFLPAVGDYDGNGISDLGLYHYATGQWYTRPLASEQLTAFGGSYWVGPRLAAAGGFVQVAGDYDGDGKTDPAMYRETTGLWSALFSGSAYAFISGTFGGAGYTAVAADYDGDGRTDPAIYNEASGQWYVLYSSVNYQVVAGTFGGPGWTAAPADYDGDRLTDGAIYKEATGLWIILPTSTLRPNGGYAPITGTFGGPGLKPIPADYTGDGTADAALYDEGSGDWYIVELSGARVAWRYRHGGFDFTPVKP